MRHEHEEFTQFSLWLNFVNLLRDTKELHLHLNLIEDVSNKCCTKQSHMLKESRRGKYVRQMGNDSNDSVVLTKQNRHTKPSVARWKGEEVKLTIDINLSKLCTKVRFDSSLFLTYLGVMTIKSNFLTFWQRRRSGKWRVYEFVHAFLDPGELPVALLTK